MTTPFREASTGIEPVTLDYKTSTLPTKLRSHLFLAQVERIELTNHGFGIRLPLTMGTCNLVYFF